MESALDRCDWSKRSADFGGLEERRNVVVMNFQPSHPWLDAEWHELCRLWLTLPQHPNIIEAIEPGLESLWLRYAAFDWNRTPLSAQPSDRGRDLFAAWGAQLIDAFKLLAARELAVLPRPFVLVDIGGHARIGFLPAITKTKNERAVVRAIGALLHELADGTGYRKDLVELCLRGKFRRVRDFERAWSARGEVRWQRTLESWRLAEGAAGLFALGHHYSAQQMFRRARQIESDLDLANAGMCECAPVVDPVPEDIRRRLLLYRGQQKRWPDVAEIGASMERERAFDKARRVYRDAQLDGVHDLAIFVAIARCSLAVGDSGMALDYAQRGLAIETKHGEAQSIRVRAHLLMGNAEHGLKCATAWIAAAPCANAHYERGRALFALARFEEAREAFERACALDPKLLEAMLLRREAERAMQKVRAKVGVQPKLELELPEHLGELRDALVNGRIDDVLAVLARAEYEQDAVAKLFHAQCLVFEKRYDEAVAMFDRVLALVPDDKRASLGKALALRELGRTEEAARLLERFPDELAI